MILDLIGLCLDSDIYAYALLHGRRRQARSSPCDSVEPWALILELQHPTGDIIL